MEFRIVTLKIYLLVFISFAMLAINYAQFTHPGLAHTNDDLARMKEKVNAGISPWVDGYNLMIQDGKAQNTYKAKPSSTIGGSGIRQQAARDATAAYYNLLRWYISGDTTYAECAIGILNDWSESINAVVTGELFMLPTMMMVQAGELARIYSGWKTADFERFKNMCRNYFYPACDGYRGYCGSWPGWDGPANACMLYIGVICDDQAMFNDAIDYYKNGTGGGRLTTMICQPNGQISEIGRDAPHAEIGPTVAADFCLAALNQGVDLFSYQDNLLLKGFEYLGKYFLNLPINWVPYNDCDDHNFYWPSNLWTYRIPQAPAYEIVYNHYVVKNKMEAPYTETMLKLRGVKSTTGEYTGYSAFTYNLSDTLTPYKALAVPEPLENLKANPGVSRIELKWDVPIAPLGHSSVIQRSTNVNGPFVTIGTWDYNTSNFFTDETVINKVTYYYRVASINDSGTSEYSNIVKASALNSLAEMPNDWNLQDIGTVPLSSSLTFNSINDRTFVLTGSGNSIGGAEDSHTFLNTQVSGDFMLTCRVFDSELSGSDHDRVGLIVRETTDPGSKMTAIGIADQGFRKTWHATRAETGSSSVSWIPGNSHTWLAVWFRLTRTGNTFTSYQSLNGVDWFGVDTVDLDMNTNAYTGIYLCSGTFSTSAITRMYIDNVTLNGGGKQPAPAPSNVNAIAINSSRVQLNWDKVPEATAYHLQRATNSSGPYITITPSLNDTMYVDSNLVSNTTYYYSIKSVNFSGDSKDSAIAEVLTPELQVPETPANLTTVAGNESVILSWDYVDAAYGYILKRANVADGVFEIIDTLSTLSYIDTSVVSGNTYAYKISAINAKGESQASEQVSITVSASIKIAGTVIGTPGSYGNNSSTTKEAAMDGDLGSFFDADIKSYAWVGLDCGRNNRVFLTGIKYAPRSDKPDRMVNGWFEAATKSDFSDAVLIHTISNQPETGLLSEIDVISNKSYRYFRYVSPDGGWGNVAEIEFWGNTIELQNQVISFDSIPNILVDSDDFDPGATASSGLPVVYTSSDTSIATIINGKIHIVNYGICMVYADQPGNDVYGSAEQISRELKVVRFIITGINNQIDESLCKAYPNPVKDNLYIELNVSENEETTIQVLNMYGQVLRSLHVENSIVTIPFNSYPKGIYILRIKSKNSDYMKKMLLE